jgi:hypothetical protein
MLKGASRLLQGPDKRIHKEEAFDPEVKEADGKCHRIPSAEASWQLPDSDRRILTQILKTPFIHSPTSDPKLLLLKPLKYIE